MSALVERAVGPRAASVGHPRAGAPQLRFAVPPELEAAEPPEARGLRRDEVRLLVAAPASPPSVHPFLRIADHLRDGDLLVVNDSATLPAAVPTVDGGVLVHLSTRLDDGRWSVELRAPAGYGSRPGPRPPRWTALALVGGGRLVLLDDGVGRLRRAALDHPGDLLPYLHRYGRPIRYAYAAAPWPLEAYQTVFARRPGSAEAPSAGLPFTRRTLRSLRRRGVRSATVTLHTGVSSLEAGEPPYAERFAVPARTAAAIRNARARGGRVLAVGTTVVRALETVAAPDGTVTGGRGWTDLVLAPHRPARVVDGLITGFHAPGASHLDLLVAVAGIEVVEEAYAVALHERLLWHELGDVALLLR